MNVSNLDMFGYNQVLLSNDRLGDVRMQRYEFPMGCILGLSSRRRDTPSARLDPFIVTRAIFGPSQDTGSQEGVLETRDCDHERGRRSVVVEGSGRQIADIDNSGQTPIAVVENKAEMSQDGLLPEDCLNGFLQRKCQRYWLLYLPCCVLLTQSACN